MLNRVTVAPLSLLLLEATVRTDVGPVLPLDKITDERQRQIQDRCARCFG